MAVDDEKRNMSSREDILYAQSALKDNGAGQGRSLLEFEANSKISSIRARAFIFSDPLSRALIPLIEQIAPSDASVLISGETGTGKELVARHIHRKSNRSKRPFVAVNCGAFSETLIESELFGHEKGAFTGASSARDGWFEAANGGTLFLDEIGELPLGLQVKLLRVLQEREVVRLGARKAIPLDIRVVAATNVDLGQAVKSGKFREDLLYRLRVISLQLPPLRERRADILPLARHFLRIYGDKIEAKYLDLSAAAEEALYSHSWFGNIRELENAVHRGTITCRQGIIQVGDLALDDSGIASRNDEPHCTMEEKIRDIVLRALDEAQHSILDRALAELVRTAFVRCKHNQLKTAAALGISRHVLRTYLKNFNIID